MTQVIDRPSLESCTRLLRAMPAMSAFRRSIRDVAPTDTLGWLGALVTIARHDDGIRPSHLAEVLHVDLSVASRSATQLEQLGYVERLPDPDDGRASILRIVPAGRTRLDELTDGFAAHVREQLAGWSDVDVDAFTQLLRRFGATLEHARTTDHAPGTDTE